MCTVVSKLINASPSIKKFAHGRLQEDEDYWPPYGCTIAFAVSTCREGAAGQEPPPETREEKKDGRDGVVLEISVDGEPLRSRLFRDHHHRGKPGAVSLSDFRTAVKHLLPPP